MTMKENAQAQSKTEQLFQSDISSVLSLLHSVKPKFGRDGDMYCFLLGGTLQEGIVGFGKTAWEAAVDFFKNFFNEEAI